MDTWPERPVLTGRLPTLLAACLLMLAGPAWAQQQYSHADRWEHYEGTKTCLECHEDAALEFFHSQHYQWRGGTPNVVNTEAGTRLGKLSLVNDFCTNPGGEQWIGKVKNDAGKTLAKGCSTCHAGFGLLPASEPSREQLENIDCLICHASGYRRDLYANEDGGWQWRPILWENQEGMDSVSRRISSPKRGMCLRCHAASGGGRNFKRGDIEYILDKPPREHDVHMAVDGADMQCTTCHYNDDQPHRVIGRGVDMAATDRTDTRLECGTSCHTDMKHPMAAIDRHLDRVACNTCHIPTFARNEPTDMRRDWSQVTFDENRGKYRYDQDLASNVTPVYAWYNGDSWVQVPGQPVRKNDKGEVTMVLPEGDRSDPDARIYPFKLHRGRLPVLRKEQWLAPIATEELYSHGDPDRAVRDATKHLYGIENAAFDWTDTIRYMGINHAVPPATEALRCPACHSEKGRLDWAALGYPGDPMKSR